MSPDAAVAAFSIPTIVWSGVVASIVASGISLGGVILANRSSERRQRDQLQHDAREKHRDRIFQLRREVYLELNTKLARAASHLGSLSGQDPTTGDFAGPINSVMAELAKVRVIGGRETAALAYELTDLYGEALFRLMGAAMPMYDLKVDININDGLYKQQFVQVERVGAEMTALTESGVPNAQRSEALRRSFEFFSESAAKFAGIRDRAHAEYNELGAAFLEFTKAEAVRISKIQVRLEGAIRTDIGLDADVDSLIKRMDETHGRVTKAADDLLSTLQQRNGLDR